MTTTDAQPTNTQNTEDVKKEVIQNQDTPIDEVMADILDEAPTAKGDVRPPESAQIEQSASTETSSSDFLDDKGNRFDPSIHEADANGSPKKTKSGLWRKKRGHAAARASKIAAERPQSKIGEPRKRVEDAPTPETPSVDVSELKRKAVAAQCTSALLTVSNILGGKKFAPTNNPLAGMSDVELLNTTFDNYFVATGKEPDMPPALALVMGISMYVAPRFMGPDPVEIKPPSVFKRWAEKIGSWVGKQKVRKAFVASPKEQKVKKPEPEHEKSGAKQTHDPAMALDADIASVLG